MLCSGHASRPLASAATTTLAGVSDAINETTALRKRAGHRDMKKASMEGGEGHRGQVCRPSEWTPDVQPRVWSHYRGNALSIGIVNRLITGPIKEAPIAASSRDERRGQWEWLTCVGTSGLSIAGALVGLIGTFG